MPWCAFEDIFTYFVCSKSSSGIETTGYGRQENNKPGFGKVNDVR